MHANKSVSELITHPVETEFKWSKKVQWPSRPPPEKWNWSFSPTLFSESPTQVLDGRSQVLDASSHVCDESSEPWNGLLNLNGPSEACIMLIFIDWWQWNNAALHSSDWKWTLWIGWGEFKFTPILLFAGCDTPRSDAPIRTWNLRYKWLQVLRQS